MDKFAWEEMMWRPEKEMQSIFVMIELHRKGFNRAIFPWKELQLKKEIDHLLNQMFLHR